MSKYLALVSVVVVCAGPALADAPAALPVFGFLEDSAGQAVHGPTSLTFRLYGASDTSVHLYRETRTVDVDRGYFSTTLSQGEGGPLDLALFSGSDRIYLGVTVGAGAELTPRLHLATSPYAAFAQYAGEAASVEGLGAADLATVDHGHAWSEVSGKPTTFTPEAHAHAFGSLTGIPAGLGDGDDDTVPAMSCSAGSVLTWTGSAYDCVVDADTQYGAAAGGGLSLSSNEFSVATGGITNAHVASGAAIAASKISGTAWTGSNDGAASGLDADLLDGRSSADFATAFRRTVVVSPVGSDVDNGTALLAALAGISGASASTPYLLHIEPGVYDLGSARLSSKAGVHIQGSGPTATTLRGIYSSSAWNDGMIRLSHPVRLSQLGVAASGSGQQVTAIYADTYVEIEDIVVNATGGTVKTSGVTLNINKSGVTRLRRVRATAENGPGDCAAFNQVVTDLIADGLHGVARNCAGTMTALHTQTGAAQVISNSSFEGGTALYCDSSNEKHELSNVRLIGTNYSMDSYNTSPVNGVKLASSLVSGPIDSVITRACVGCFNAAFAPLNATCQ